MRPAPIPRPPVRRCALAAFATLGLLAVQLAAGAGCGGEDTTTGQRVALGTRVTAGDDAREPFTNAAGWEVTVTRALVSVGELYYFDGAPVVAGLAPPRTRGRDGVRSLLDALAIREAHAHPGHYTEGNAQGQMLTPRTVDLIAPFSDLAAADAVSGMFRSARFTFASPAVGPLAAELGAHVVLIEGSATKDGVTKAFRGTLGPGDVLTEGVAAVEGCEFVEAAVEADGVVTLTIKPSVWLDQAEFDQVAESEDGEPALLVPGEPAHKALSRGVKKGTAYVFSYAP